MTEQSRLIVLGGSAAGGNTGAGSSGYLLGDGVSTLLIDPGPGTFPELRKHTDFRQLTAIVLSHMHLDHMHDLAAMVYALKYSPLSLERKIPLWLPPGGRVHLHRIGSNYAGEPESGFFDTVFEVTEYEPEEVLECDSITVRFAPAVHSGRCWAMLLQTTRATSRTGYTADTGPTAPLDEFFSGVDLLVSESTWLEPKLDQEPRLHMTAAEAGTLATRCHANRLVLAHWWEELGEENYLTEARSTFSGPVYMAKPGLTLPIL